MDSKEKKTEKFMKSGKKAGVFGRKSVKEKMVMKTKDKSSKKY